MNILFILPKVEHSGCIMLGPAYIHSFLKSHGHNIDILNFSYSQFSKEKIYNKIKKFQPKLIGISVLSAHLTRQTKEIAETIKKSFNTIIIVGGPAVTVDGDNFINCKDIEMVCIGEGEYPLLELVNKIGNQTDYTDIKNLWIKKNGKIIKNKIRPLERNLDEFPFPDRTLFPDTETIHIITGRGCPYDCNYCINKELRKMYGAVGYVRYRSPENVISEILEIKSNYSPKSLWFSDDVFPFKKEWLSRFSKLYIEHNINIPFSINLRPEQYDKNLIKNLKEIGLFEVRTGIETGDEYIRKKKLNRIISDADIKNTFELAKKYGLKRKVYNMIGIPGETKEAVFKTIIMSLKIKPEVMQYSIFQPYPGTALNKECIEKGYKTKDIESIKDYYSESTISTEYLSSKDVNNLYQLAKFIWKNRKIFTPILRLHGKVVNFLFNVILYTIPLLVMLRNIHKNILKKLFKK